MQVSTRRKMRNAAFDWSKLFMFLCLVFALVGFAPQAWAAENDTDEKIESLSEKVRRLSQELEQLKEKQKQASEREEKRRQRHQQELAGLKNSVSEMESSSLFDPDAWVNRFTIGGYGELHMNFGGDGDADQFDIHRVVAYVGYKFNEWISLATETEMEHAFVKDGDGKVLFEQAYVDFNFTPAFNVRFGRVLTPVGIINKWHEPTTFNGVERPAFSKYVLPTTWSSDGLGVYGSFSPEVSYEAYVVGGLDGSQFDAIEGIRDGRISERPSLNDVAVTGRVDYRPFATRSVDVGEMRPGGEGRVLSRKGEEREIPTYPQDEIGKLWE